MEQVEVQIVVIFVDVHHVVNLEEKKQQATELKISIILLFAIRMGYFYSVSSSPRFIFEECFQFIIQRQRIPVTMTMTPICQLKNILISGGFIEGYEITAEFFFSCEDHIHRDSSSEDKQLQMTGYVKYQWYRIHRDLSIVLIPGATNKVSVSNPY